MSTLSVAPMTRWPTRKLIAAILAFDLLMLGAIVARAKPSDVSWSGPAWLLWLGGKPFMIAPIVAIGLGGTVGLWRGRRSVASGVVVLAIAALLDELLAALFGTPMRFLFHGGVLLVGWLAGLAWWRLWWGAARDESEAWREHVAACGAIGALAATYFGACTSKLLAHGFGWADAQQMQMLVLGHHHFDSPGFMDRAAGIVVRSPRLGLGLGVATLVIQAGAPMLLAGPRVRRVWSMLLLGFHTCVWLLTHILFPQVMLFLVAIALPTRDASIAIPPTARPRGRDVSLAIATLAVLVALAALTPGFLARYAPRAASDPASAPVEVLRPASPEVSAALGRVGVGSEIVGWTVRSIAGTEDDGAVVRVERGAQSLELSVVPHGRRPFPPPAEVSGWDIFTGHALPVDRPPSTEETTALVGGLRSRIASASEP